MDDTKAEKNKYHHHMFIIYGNLYHWIINFDTYTYTFRIQIHLWLSQIRVMKEIKPITFSWEEIAIPGDTL